MCGLMCNSVASNLKLELRGQQLDMQRGCHLGTALRLAAGGRSHTRIRIRIYVYVYTYTYIRIRTRIHIRIRIRICINIGCRGRPARGVLPNIPVPLG